MLAALKSWFFSSLTERRGEQYPVPGAALVDDTSAVGVDLALQISTVWACIERRATVIASLPFFVYQQQDGQKVLARDSRLYALLHDSPNARMTPLEFWRAMMINHDLRGNAYARIERDARTGEALALWPMPADQVRTVVLDDGSVVYEYRIDSDVAVLPAENVLHLKNLGNGTVGLAKLEFMRSTLDEARKAQQSASKLFGSGGKPTGLLMIDHVMKPEQRKQVQQRFAEMAMGSTSRLFVLEANMKYEQLSLTPEDMQLLDSRKFSVSQLCQWFDVPPVLVHHGEGVTYNGATAVIEAWHKLTVRPIIVNIEQAVRKRVLTPRQRATMQVEMSFDALLRADAPGRAAFYAVALQNGYMTRNEVRQLENLPPNASGGADDLTAQSNLIPLALMGRVQNLGGPDAPAQDPVAQ